MRRIKHIDLFSGIGGFALATEWAFGDVEHVFCDIEPFAQSILKKHWPNSKIYGDIRTLTADAERDRQLQPQGSEQEERGRTGDQVDILTGGFPCQPFSQAGLRRGTEDDRHLWPEMLRVIREFKPRWVVGENVSGLLTWNDGLVFEQVCAELEEQGYEVQAFIIPACGVNAPHRRNRVWIVAHSNSDEHRGWGGQSSEADGIPSVDRSPVRPGKPSGAIETLATTNATGERERGSAGEERRVQSRVILESEQGGSALRSESERRAGNASDTERTGLEEREEEHDARLQGALGDDREQEPWDNNWLDVATELCGVDDGLPAELDGLKLTKAGHRNARLKALGNAIVPQVAYQIMLAIKQAEA